MKSIRSRMALFLIACIGCALWVSAAETPGENKSITGSNMGQFKKKKKNTAKKEFVPDALKTRSSRRAFYTAPPVIPHKVGNTDKECLSCHGKKTRKYQGLRSMKTPHPELINCQQCHLKSSKPDYIKQPRQMKGSKWVGLEEPLKGTRYHDYAPPTIPHRLFLRENCNTCHSKKHPKIEMRSTHSERTNCVQCHVMDKTNEFKIKPNP